MATQRESNKDLGIYEGLAHTESVFGQPTAGEETPIVEVASCVGGFQPRLDHTMVRGTAGEGYP